MILAIGNIRLFRDRVTHLHPFGFFTAALEVNPPSESSFSSISDVENLLLIALFGVYYNIGCSIWELARLCVRICIELQLHRQGTQCPTITTAGSQRCGRVFWESYLLDRFASSMLGRPFTIDDSLIDVELPNEPSESVFNHLVRLGRITSTIHASAYCQFPRAPNSLDNPDIMMLRNFHAQLKAWRHQAPVFEASHCFYSTQEFFELTYQEARLWLFRVAINHLPARSSNMRDKLLLLCLQAAQRIIECFNILWQTNLATYSRAFMRLILVSGLITVSVIKIQMHTGRNHPKEHSDSDVGIDTWLEDIGLDTSTCFPALSACRDTLEKAGKILSWLAIQMPDVSAYAQIFETLNGEVDTLSSNTWARSAQPSSPLESAQLSELTEDPISVLGNQQIPGISHGDGLLPDVDGLLGNDTFWSFTDAAWMGEIEDNISGFIWDTMMPWQGSPLDT
ncbi:hypothetical protein BS50DRAFT_540411 [Corynespora cassiicola Philippines]|uniref:Xylanolytic transcriptional activator regulatory domain-containing protein n=1 Tax=Corynespora cassiicola Philippines TaxID=1448308 RepID=A0A2T2PB18_CORCC|nr:hypothetical protein BS50DRAFT_540411 [Corynespora cassiicola Philippines]